MLVKEKWVGFNEPLPLSADDQSENSTVESESPPPPEPRRRFVFVEDSDTTLEDEEPVPLLSSDSDQGFTPVTPTRRRRRTQPFRSPTDSLTSPMASRYQGPISSMPINTTTVLTTSTIDPNLVAAANQAVPHFLATPLPSTDPQRPHELMSKSHCFDIISTSSERRQVVKCALVS